MKRSVILICALSFVMGTPLDAQEMCRTVTAKEISLLPSMVPLEMETIPVQRAKAVAIEFHDRTQIVIAPLDTAGFSPQIRARYQYILVSDTRVYLDDCLMPAGMVGLGMVAETSDESLTRTVIARDFSGQEIDQISVRFEPAADRGVALLPSGPKEFLLRFGRYVVEGRQR